MRLARLDHLRFIGCLAVMAWHFTPHYVSPIGQPAVRLLAPLEEGHTGVALFCVISGFIFAWLYADQAIDYRQFLAKRARRILPLFLVMALLAFYVYPQWGVGGFLGALSTLQNGFMPGLMAPGWSVLVEFQFYLVLPFLLLFTRRYGLLYLAGLWAFFLAVRWLVWLDAGAVKNLAYFTIFGRADQFLAGMLAAFACKWSGRTERPALWAFAGPIILAAGILALSLFYMKFNKGGGYYGPNEARSLFVYLPTVEAACYGSIVGGYLLSPHKQIFGGYFSAVFAYLGQISYSMYLTHLLVFAALFKLTDMRSLALSWESAFGLFLVTALPSVAIISSATHFLIERPFMDLPRRRLAEVVPLKTSLAA